MLRTIYTAHYFQGTFGIEIDPTYVIDVNVQVE